MIKIGINGFGRIGRMAAKALLEYHREDMEIVAVNDLTDAPMLAHLYTYDSFFGIEKESASAKDAKTLSIGGKDIFVFAERDPAKIPWGDLGVDIVLECTGIFKTKDQCQAHLDAGSKKVIISAPAKDDTPTYVMGVNHQLYGSDENIISNASCTTNCLAPVTKVVLEHWGISTGMMTTIHSMTASQHLQDAPDKDYRKARAATLSLIPTSTGAAKALGKVIPEVAGKMDGFAVRVPTPNVSLIDVTFVTEKELPSKEKINEILTVESSSTMKGVLEVSHLPLVSMDYRRHPASSIVDGLSTMVLGKNMLKILSWYDNEWGYSCRLVDLAKYIGEK